MPDATGRFLGAFFGLSPDRHDRLFGSTSDNPVEIEWEPDFCLDGATFTPECSCEGRCEGVEGCKNPKS